MSYVLINRMVADPRMREHIQRAIPLLVGMPEQHRVMPVGGKAPFALPDA